jgi:hypothetical protein
MSNSISRLLIAASVASIHLLMPRPAAAVGNGVPFVFREGFVPAIAHPVAANSQDLTYHSCVNFVDEDSFQEIGYFWISSFQDAVGVVDSQINDFQANGYHIYARYSFEADQWGGVQVTPSGFRMNYLATGARIQLYLDPLSDTVLGISECQITAAGTADDVLLGGANVLLDGEKSETNGLANGDFELVFANWLFTAAGQTLYRDVNGNPLFAPQLVFNANITLLIGPLGDDHRAEGSGNIYWRD